MKYTEFRDQQIRENKPFWMDARQANEIHPIVLQEMFPYLDVWFGMDRRAKCRLVCEVEGCVRERYRTGTIGSIIIGMDRRAKCRLVCEVEGCVRERYRTGIIGSIIIGVIVRMIVWWLIKWIEDRREKSAYTLTAVHEEFQEWETQIRELNLTPPRR